MKDTWRFFVLSWLHFCNSDTILKYRHVHTTIFKWVKKRTYCIAQGTLLSGMWQPGWEGSLGENRMYIYDWVVCWAPETITTSLINYFSFSTVQSLSLVWLFVIPWTAACQASLSITNSRSSPKPTSIESVMPFNHLILVIPFSSCPQSFPASGSFQMSQLSTSGGQNSLFALG